MRGKELLSLDSWSNTCVESSCEPPQQPTTESFLVIFDQQKQKPGEICPKEWHGCLRHQVGSSRRWKSVLTQLHHSQQTHSVRSSPCYTHKYHGGPETLVSFFFARKSSLDWGCRLRTDRPEELDETWFQPHHGSQALISSPHGVFIKLKLLRRTSYSLTWFVSHPSLCLSSQSAGSVSLLMNFLFWTGWLHLFGFSETLIRYMEGFHKPQISPFIWLSEAEWIRLFLVALKVLLP